MSLNTAYINTYETNPFNIGGQYPYPIAMCLNTLANKDTIYYHHTPASHDHSPAYASDEE